ncbi:hypothetical protein [Streptomyces anandii]|uniref:hypothetical protein n=1 Tax=Streptomyces anandii TaxID=285454 RepID=UPI0037BD2DFF
MLNTRLRRRPAPSPDHVRGVDLNARHRIDILSVIFVVLVVLVTSEHSVTGAFALITAAGAAAAQAGTWLNGQRPVADSSGGL